MECRGFEEVAAVGVEARRPDGGLPATPPVFLASGAGVTVSGQGVRWRSAAVVCRVSRMLQTERSSSRVFMTNPEDHADFPAAPERSKARRFSTEQSKKEKEEENAYMPQLTVAPCWGTEGETTDK